MELVGKQALITGAGRGIGKGCAVELARAGADVIINDRPDSPDLKETTEHIRGLGRNCVAIPADIFGRDGCESLVRAALDVVEHIDIFVSNPAIALRGSFPGLDPDDFERVITGALTSGFHMSQLVSRNMINAARGGKIVFISSVHALLPYAGFVAYNAAKAGLNQMARTIAGELARHRINVNIIEPGWIDTPGQRQDLGDDFLEREGAKLPWRRLGRPEDIGKAAAFLCSDHADYITGAVLRVDGGFVLKDCLGPPAPAHDATASDDPPGKDDQERQNGGDK